MGYWGDFVVARSERPATELAPFATKPGCSDGDTDCFLERDERPGGWQILRLCHYLPGDDYDWWLSELVNASGAPVMIATVADSGTAMLQGQAPSGANWTTFLDPENADNEGMLGYLADPEGEFEDEPEEAALQRVLDAAPESAEQIASWAAEAGLDADVDAVRGLLLAKAEPLVEDIFYELLDAAGLPESS